MTDRRDQGDAAGRMARLERGALARLERDVLGVLCDELEGVGLFASLLEARVAWRKSGRDLDATRRDVEEQAARRGAALLGLLHA